MHEPEKFGVYQGQIQTYAAFSGMMAGVVMFFTGIILTRYENYDASIRVPIAYLLISIFGFLYGTLLYTNAAEEVSDFNEARFRRAMTLGDIVSEYLGVYLLVMSIPLIINIITADAFLRVVTLVSSLAGLAVYQFSHFSILERHFRARGHALISVLILVLGLVLFLCQRLSQPYFVGVAAAFLLLVIVLACVAARKPAHAPAP